MSLVIPKGMNVMPDEFGSFINNLGDFEKALQEEYELAIGAEDTISVRKIIETKIAKALPGLVDDLLLIARLGDNDNAKLKAIKFAFDWYFQNNTEAQDPFTALLNQLTENDTPDKTDPNAQLRPGNTKEA
jgi:hypothetical protein